MLEKLACHERNEVAQRARRVVALHLNLVDAQRQRRNQALFLLEIQLHQLVALLLEQRSGAEEDVAKLPLAVRRVQNQERHHKHALILPFQCQLLGLGVRAHLLETTGENVHVVTGTNSFLLFLDGHLVKVCDHVAQLLERFHLIDGMDVHAHDEIGLDLQQISEQIVVQLLCEDLHHRRARPLVAHLKAAAGPEIKAGRRNEILRGQTGGNEPVPFKLHPLLHAHVEDAVHHAQAFLAVNRLGGHADALELAEQADLKPFKLRSGGFDAARLDGKGQVLALRQAVVALGKLASEHSRVFLADFVKLIALQGNHHAALKVLHAGRHIDKGKLEVHRRIKRIEEIAPRTDNRFLVLFLRLRVVDVLKLDGLGIDVVLHMADAIRIHGLVVNRLLRGIRLSALIPRLRLKRFDLLLLRPRELHFGLSLFGQSSLPPFRC